MIKKIKTPFTTYKIEYHKELKGSKTHDLYGSVSYDNEIINVATKYCYHKQLQTIMHEALHAIHYDLCLSNREKEIELISGAIMKFIQENPEFVKEIIKIK
ncbi:MAG: hypothetical protein ACOWWR_18590 [Eubacteriales bacterium]